MDSTATEELQSHLATEATAKAGAAASSSPFGHPVDSEVEKGFKYRGWKRAFEISGALLALIFVTYGVVHIARIREPRDFSKVDDLDFVTVGLSMICLNGIAVLVLCKGHWELSMWFSYLIPWKGRAIHFMLMAVYIRPSLCYGNPGDNWFMTDGECWEQQDILGKAVLLGIYASVGMAVLFAITDCFDNTEIEQLGDGKTVFEEAIDAIEQTVADAENLAAIDAVAVADVEGVSELVLDDTAPGSSAPVAIAPVAVPAIDVNCAMAFASAVTTAGLAASCGIAVYTLTKLVTWIIQRIADHFSSGFWFNAYDVAVVFFFASLSICSLVACVSVNRTVSTFFGFLYRTIGRATFYLFMGFYMYAMVRDDVPMWIAHTCAVTSIIAGILYLIMYFLLTCNVVKRPELPRPQKHLGHDSSSFSSLEGPLSFSEIGIINSDAPRRTTRKPVPPGGKPAPPKAPKASDSQQQRSASGAPAPDYIRWHMFGRAYDAVWGGIDNARIGARRMFGQR